MILRYFLVHTQILFLVPYRPIFLCSFHKKGSKCLMKCGNKIEKQKLNEANFLLKFYFSFFFLPHFRGWNFFFPSLLYVCLILFFGPPSISGSSNWMWKSEIIIFLSHWTAHCLLYISISMLYFIYWESESKTIVWMDGGDRFCV